MADTFSQSERSKIMSAVKSKDTRPEIIVRKYLFNKGLRFRKNDRKLPGTPDISIKKYNTVIFVNGCFWHGHENCKHSSIPKSNSIFWQNKIVKNISRDKKKTLELKKIGWKVIVIWTCKLSEKDLDSLYKKIIK